MKTRLSKIGIILAASGFLMMFGNYVPPCEPNSMIQTFETRICDMSYVILLYIANLFSYLTILVGLVLLSYGFVRSKQRKKIQK